MPAILVARSSGALFLHEAASQGITRCLFSTIVVLTATLRCLRDWRSRFITIPLRERLRAFHFAMKISYEIQLNMAL